MIVECYSADVYCDNTKCVRNYKRDVFTGRNKRECDKERRNHGWVKIKGKDICPECIENKVEIEFGED